VTLHSGDGLVQIELEIETPLEKTFSNPQFGNPSTVFPSPGFPLSQGGTLSGTHKQQAQDASLPRRVLETDSLALKLEAAFERAFSLRIPVREVPHGTLPRFDFKARRWVLLEPER
jgi:hypothetical protein